MSAEMWSKLDGDVESGASCTAMSELLRRLEMCDVRGRRLLRKRGRLCACVDSSSRRTLVRKAARVESRSSSLNARRMRVCVRVRVCVCVGGGGGKACTARVYIAEQSRPHAYTHM